MNENRPVSPVNGQPVPEGRRFEPGEKQRESSRMAGRRSGEARRKRKTLRNELITLLSDEISNKNGEKMQAQHAMTMALLKSALSGSVRAFEVIRDTIGEKPVENVNITTGNFDALNDAFEALKDDGK